MDAILKIYQCCSCISDRNITWKNGDSLNYVQITTRLFNVKIKGRTENCDCYFLSQKQDFHFKRSLKWWHFHFKRLNDGIFILTIHLNDGIFIFRRHLNDEILYKYILLVRVICEKYRLRGEANIPSRFSLIPPNI